MDSPTFFASECYANENSAPNTGSLPSSHYTRQEVAVGASHRSGGISENCLVSPSWSISASTADAVLPPFRRYSLEIINSNSAKNTAPSFEPTTPPEKATTKKRSRMVLTAHQLSALEKKFKAQQFLSSIEGIKMAAELDLTYKQIKTWFSNRRMKDKKEKQSKFDVSSETSSVRETLSLSPASVSSDSSPTQQRVTKQNAPTDIAQIKIEHLNNYNFMPPQHPNTNETPLQYYNQDGRLVPQQYSTITERMVYQHTLGQQCSRNYESAPQETRPNHGSFRYANQQYPNNIGPQNINPMQHDDPQSSYFPLSRPNDQNIWSHRPYSP